MYAAVVVVADLPIPGLCEAQLPASREKVRDQISGAGTIGNKARGKSFQMF